MKIYETFDDDGLGAAWSLGDIDTHEFASALSARMNRPTESIIEHMTERCHHIHFFENAYAFFKAKHLPQAIVTVNPDLFSDVIVPICGFEEDCNAIVTSWEERTIDKRVLNQIAIERLEINCGESAGMLIDNKRSNIDDWIGAGGAGYHYIGDDVFATDSANGIDAMAELS